MTSRTNLQHKNNRSVKLFKRDPERIDLNDALFRLPERKDFDKLQVFSNIRRNEGERQHKLAALYDCTGITTNSEVLKGFTAPLDPSSLEQVTEQLEMAMSRLHRGCVLDPNAKAIVLSYRHTTPEERKQRTNKSDARLNEENIVKLANQIMQYDFEVGKLQIWVDQIYCANRASEAGGDAMWSNEAIVPYGLFPVFYYHNTEGDEKVTKDRTWLAVEREMAISGEGYYFLDTTRSHVAWFAPQYKNLSPASHGKRSHFDNTFREAAVNLLAYIDDTETYWKEDRQKLKSMALNSIEYGLSAIVCRATKVTAFYGMRTARGMAMYSASRLSLDQAITCGDHMQMRCNGRFAKKEQYLMASRASWDGILEWTHPNATNDISCGVIKCCDTLSYYSQAARTLSVLLNQEDRNTGTKFYLHVMINSKLEPFRGMVCKVSECCATEIRFDECYVLGESEFSDNSEAMMNIAQALQYSDDIFSDPYNFWKAGGLQCTWTAGNDKLALGEGIKSLVKRVYGVILDGSGTIGRYSDDW